MYFLQLTGQSSSSSDTHQSMPSLPSQTPGMIPIIPMYSSMGQLSAISPQSLLAQPQTNTATGAKKKGILIMNVFFYHATWWSGVVLGFPLLVAIRPPVCPSALGFRFLTNSFWWISFKFCVHMYIRVDWFEIVNRQFLSIFDEISAHHTIVKGYYRFTFFFFFFFLNVLIS